MKLKNIHVRRSVEKTQSKAPFGPSSCRLSSETAFAFTIFLRIDVFWNVLILAKTLAIALDCPTDVCGTLEAPGLQIDTPWPGILLYPTTCIVHTCLHPTPNTDTPGSLLTLTAQASILLQQVTYLVRQSNLADNLNLVFVTPLRSASGFWFLIYSPARVL
ncbi:uncharacterized protein BT62DRAFT_1009255 [Guyanagaster necrorhizus]|uniref:Uncharacterized protein n=1 Tax=Guyanagaster necrorhizus TaxID=856835 RepID=A0A9P7VMU4_9AGAR|nr:uncharacterized protein BT62DRAFT_1009255 [Guyanagaster necrorhizus MCA 3950]KAG7443440.1 hypothetical protein BT62DRAFT_1009255 [Guyanagaster necrorhizus MCA 3950]